MFSFRRQTRKFRPKLDKQPFQPSIKNCSFVAYHCKAQKDFYSNLTKCHLNSKDELKSPARMGFHADLSAPNFKTSYGNFFLNTTGTHPFCVINANKTGKNVAKKGKFRRNNIFM